MTVAPTFETVTPSGIEIRFFAEDKETKTKRHYQGRGVAIIDGQKFEHPWIELVSVTTAQKVLNKESLKSWAQRIGAKGMIELFNMKALQPVAYNGQTVLGANVPGRGLIVIGEQEAVELLKQHRLTINDKRDEGGVRGQSCHDALEGWSKTGIMPNPATYPISEQGYVSALVSFLQDSGAESVRCEVLVASLEYEFAGRFDNDLLLPKPTELLTHHTPSGQARYEERLMFDSGLYRVDLKTAKDAFEENGEQLEAYEKGAVECGLPETLQRCVIHCNSEGRYKFVPVGSGEPKSTKFPWSTFEDYEATLRKYKLTEARKERMKNGS